MKPASILRQLRHVRGGFPEAALREALGRREALEPHLLDALRDTPRQLRARGDDWMLHHFALYLTAAWRTREALPLIVDFFAHPGDLPVEATGDFATGDLARALASVAHGRLGPIRHLVGSTRVSEWSRSAGINAVVIMHLTGQLAEGEAAEYLRHLAESGLDEQPGVYWCSLAMACGRLRLDGMLPAIARAYERGLIDPTYVPLEDVAAELSAPGSRGGFAQPRYETLIDDPVADLARLDWSPTEAPSSAPARRPSRNAPCPCGSGRKYKQCCLRGADADESHSPEPVKAAVVADNALTTLVEAAQEQAREGEATLACRIYAHCWELVTARLTPEMTTLDDLDAALPRGVFAGNLVFEYLIELENAAQDDPAWAATGIEFCEFIEGRFADAAAHEAENLRGARGQFLFRAGDPARGEAVLRDLIAADPRRTAGYALLADALGCHLYDWNGRRPLDPARAVAVLEEAVAVGVEDGDDWDLAPRLDEMRERAGEAPGS